MADERLINKLTKQTRTAHPVQWPDSEETIGLIVPTCQELQDAFAEARKRVSSTLGLSLEAAVNGNILQEEDEARVLALVTLDVAGEVANPQERRLFKGVSEVRAKLTTDQRLYLVAHLNKFQEAIAEGWNWPDDGDSRERMALALDMPGASLSAIADRVEKMCEAD
jgi:hypothetical protein